MSFHDVRLNESVERGARGGPGFRTTIVTLASGFEQRNGDWAQARGEYDISYGVTTKELFREVLNFFRARRGRLFGFRFKDWSDYKCEVDQGVIGAGDGSQTQFQLVKVYQDLGGSYTRIIHKPVAGTTRMFLDGSETLSFTVDNSTGVVTFATAPGAAVAVTASFEFDVPVRFDTDAAQVSLNWENAGSVSQLSLVELRLPVQALS